MNMDASSGMNMDSSMDTGAGEGMSSTFFASTATPLFSIQWTPTTTAGYAGTCIFLILMTVFFRALFAVREKYEQCCYNRHLSRRYVSVAGKPSEAMRISTDSDAKNAMLVTAQGVEEEVRVVERHLREPMPWGLASTGPRALLVTVMVGVGYLL